MSLKQTLATCSDWFTTTCAGAIHPPGRNKRRPSGAATDTQYVRTTELLENRLVLSGVADAYEPNDSVSSATDLGIISGRRVVSGVSLHSAVDQGVVRVDQDFFRFELVATSGREHRISISISNPSGSIVPDVALLDAQGKVIRFTEFPDHDEISLASQSPGVYFLRVHDFAHYEDWADGEVQPPVPYTLYFHTPELPVVDSYEPNNTLAAAANIGIISGRKEISGLSIHTSSDRDFFRFQTIATGRKINTVSLYYHDEKDSLRMRLRDARGNIVSGSQNKAYAELEGLAAGVYYIEVYGLQGARNTYTLAFATPGRTFKDVYEPSDFRSEATDLGRVSGRQTITSLSLHSGKDEDFFRFQTVRTASANHYVDVVDVMFLTAPHFFRNERISAELLDASSGQVVRTGDRKSGGGVRLSLRALPAGTYFVRVYGGWGWAENYSLIFDAPVLPSGVALSNISWPRSMSWGAVADGRSVTGFASGDSSAQGSEGIWSYFKFDTVPSEEHQIYSLRLQPARGVTLDVELLNSRGRTIQSASGAGILVLPFNPAIPRESYGLRVRQTRVTSASEIVSFTARFQASPNFAPVLNRGGTPYLNPVRPGTSSSQNGGTTVLKMISGMSPGGGITDVDAHAQRGIAIISRDNTNGRWQYSTNGGATWNNIGLVTIGTGRLLAVSASNRIRFVPKAGFVGKSTLRFLAWDQTRGRNGDLHSVLSRGGSTPFSSMSHAATIQVNSAPLLNASGNPELTPIRSGIPVRANTGTSVLQIIAGMSPGGGIFDSDRNSLKGIALTSLSGLNNGRWQYSLNGGTTWQSIGTVRNTSVLLLAATSSTRVRFLPNAGFSGTVNMGFFAWDRTIGTNGGRANASSRGGAHAFSTQSETARLMITPLGRTTRLLDDVFSSELLSPR